MTKHVPAVAALRNSRGWFERNEERIAFQVAYQVDQAGGCRIYTVNEISLVDPMPIAA